MTKRDWQQDIEDKSKRILSYALDMIRPQFLGLGLRVSRIQRLFCEIKLPARAKNLDERGEQVESAVIGAGLEAFYILWKRHLPEGGFSVNYKGLNFTKHKPMKGDLFARFELPELAREAHLAELRKNKISEQETSIYFFDADEQRVADLQIQAELKITELLEWK